MSNVDIEETIRIGMEGIIATISQIPTPDDKLDKIIELLESIDSRLSIIEGVLGEIQSEV